MLHHIHDLQPSGVLILDLLELDTVEFVASSPVHSAMQP